jgi:hypothetical protein
MMCVRSWVCGGMLGYVFRYFVVYYQGTQLELGGVI